MTARERKLTIVREDVRTDNKENCKRVKKTKITKIQTDTKFFNFNNRNIIFFFVGKYYEMVSINGSTFTILII